MRASDFIVSVVLEQYGVVPGDPIGDVIKQNQLKKQPAPVATTKPATPTVTPTPAVKPTTPAPEQQPKVTMSYLSAHTDAEDMLHKAAKSAGIKGTELAQFLAQCYHESAGFSTMQEYATGAEYEGRKDLGNIYKGDGVRYKGRGFIQITGRDNYRRAGQALGLPLEQQPELAGRLDVAARIAVWYWQNRVKPNVGNFNDTQSVTRYINPNMRGLADRHENFKDYKNMFSMEKL
jgi:putative chitinase